MKNAPEEIKDPISLPPRTRLRLAQYFKSIKSVRTIAFYEAILSLIKAPRKAGVREIFELSDYYTENGDWEMAAETRLRMGDYTTAEPYLANANVEAARMYAEHGQTERARSLYARAQQSNYGWAAGIAVIDQGRTLINKGKYEDAIEVLSKPVKGKYANQIEPVKRMLVGDAYYRRGDLLKAQENIQAAISAYHALLTPLSGEGLENIFAAAEERLKIITRWIKEPIQLDSHEVHIAIDKNQLQKEPIIQRLRVRTYRDAPLMATVNNENITAQILSVHEWGQLSTSANNRESEKEVIIKVTALPQNNSKVLLTISSTQYEDFTIQVPIYLDVNEM